MVMQHLPPKNISQLLASSLTARQWLAPADDFFRGILARPEIAPVPESCAAELALYAALDDAPSMPVAPEELLALEDRDARESYTHFLRFRDGLLAAGTLEAYYLRLFPRKGGGQVNIPHCLLTCWWMPSRTACWVMSQTRTRQGREKFFFAPSASAPKMVRC